MKTEIIILLGTLGGALLGFFSSIITIWITKSYENKKQYREALLTAAIKHWEGIKEVGMRQGDILFYPLDVFLIHHAKIAKLISEEKLDKEAIKKILKESDEIFKLYQEDAKKNIA